MGFSDLGCYGGEVDTPTWIVWQRAVSATASSTHRALLSVARVLLTGLYPHQADIGHMMGTHGLDGYLGDLSPDRSRLLRP